MRKLRSSIEKAKGPNVMSLASQSEGNDAGVERDFRRFQGIT